MAATPAVAEPNKVFIGNLNRETTEDTIRSVFGGAGTITNVELAPSRKYGWVTFASADGVSAAVALSGTMVDEFAVRVEAHKPYAPNPKTIFVGNLPVATPEGDVLSMFTKYGAVEGVKMIDTRREDIRHCYVTFESEDAAATALEMDGAALGEQTLRVEPEARRKRERRAGRAAGSSDGGAGAPRARRRRARGPREVDPRRVFVANLGRDLETEDLKAHFGECGEIVKVLRRYGYAFLTFATDEGVDAALAMSGTSIGDREIAVERESGRGSARAEGGAEGGAGAPRARRARAPRRRTAGSEDEAPLPLVARTDTVWVGGLPDGATEEDVNAAFAACGPITRVAIGRNGKFAHVQFAEDGGATAAVDAGAAGAVTVHGTALAVEQERGRPAADPCQVYVGNLPESATEDDIRQFLASAGDIEHVSMRGRGVAYVRFAAPENATSATSIQGTINDNDIRVEMAQPPRRRRRRGPASE